MEEKLIAAQQQGLKSKHEAKEKAREDDKKEAAIQYEIDSKLITYKGKLRDLERKKELKSLLSKKRCKTCKKMQKKEDDEERNDGSSDQHFNTQKNTLDK